MTFKFRFHMNEKKGFNISFFFILCNFQRPYRLYIWSIYRPYMSVTLGQNSTAIWYESSLSNHIFAALVMEGCYGYGVGNFFAVTEKATTIPPANVFVSLQFLH